MFALHLNLTIIENNTRVQGPLNYVLSPTHPNNSSKQLIPPPRALGSVVTDGRVDGHFSEQDYKEQPSRHEVNTTVPHNHLARGHCTVAQSIVG